MEDESLPIPRSSCDTTELIAASRKIQKRSALPCSLIVVVKQGICYSIVGLLTVLECRRFGEDESVSTMEQFHSYSKATHKADVNGVVIWTVDKCCGLAPAPKLLDASDVSVSGGMISKSFLTDLGYQKAMSSSVWVDGIQISMSCLLSGMAKQKTIILADHVWEHLLHTDANELVTPKGHARHMGLSDHEILPARVVPRFGSNTNDQAHSDGLGDLNNGDLDENLELDDATDLEPYSFPVTIAAMRLGHLLRSAAHIKEAVTASLLLATSDNSVHAEAFWFAHTRHCFVKLCFLNHARYIANWGLSGPPLSSQ